MTNPTTVSIEKAAQVAEPRNPSRIQLRTHLPPAECWERLGTIADFYRLPAAWHVFFGSKPLLATRRGERIRLIPRLRFGQGYHGYFYGRIKPDDDGTLIEGRFGVPWWFHACAVLWGLLWAGKLIVDLWTDGGRSGLVAIRESLFMLCAMVIPVAANLWNLRTFPNAMPGLLETTFEATRQSDG
ncbi:MAG TPA: hypothetical protein VGG30_12715 [Pirellulales bacterium]|jgi:hypothetical protein